MSATETMFNIALAVCIQYAYILMVCLLVHLSLHNDHILLTCLYSVIVNLCLVSLRLVGVYLITETSDNNSDNGFGICCGPNRLIHGCQID